ncbi:MAG: 4Fe-4S dicluster domain-containing (seleno)protein, partial [Pseudomonadota bacterium]
YEKERIFYGRIKAEQIKATNAGLVVVPCHSCNDQIKKSIRKEYHLEELEVKFLWQAVADAIIT